MAAFTGKLLLFLAIYLAEKVQAQDNFGIVEPFPENIYPIEYTSAQVTCVAFDSSGEKTPDRIQFMRKSNFAIYTSLTANENLYFTTRTELEEVNGPNNTVNATKLFVTMHIINVTQDDDSQMGKLGRYECHAFAVNDTQEKKHGFTVNVISKKEIPEVIVPKLSVLKHGDDILITCNLTEGMGSTTLNRISWFKDGVEIQSVRNPDPNEPKDSLGPLELKNVGVRDGGEYECRLEVKLRKRKDYNVSDTTMVRIAAWLDKPKEDVEIKKFKGNDVSFVCAARGFPLQVEWKIKKKNEDKIGICINESDGNYQISRMGPYDPYELTVSDVQYTDRGFYYCCLPSNCSDDVEVDCQRFILRVRDPLGPLWPVIGILIEALVLFLIIFVAERRKKNKEGADKPDGRVEFSFSSTDDGDRGQVRLRRVGETPVA